MFSHSRRNLLLGISILVAGLVLIACSGNGSSSSGNVVDVTVTATDFKFESSLTTFKQGVTYHFVVTNNGTVNHEFMIMPPEPDTITPDQVTKLALAGIGSDKLTPGSTQTLDYTFTKAYPAGTLEFACHVPGHYDAGMHLPIVVQ